MIAQKHILLFGAGKSATVLIDYLKTMAEENQWRVTVADLHFETVAAKVGDHPFVTAKQVDLDNIAERSSLIASADLVISLLPPFLQFPVAKDCLDKGKHFLSASYTDPEIQLLAKAIEQKGILFLCEMGLDPGIDHMSAMQMIDEIRKKGGVITSFRSHCGGLVAPESDDNPWHYKFSWNPRNVVMAGKAGAIFKQANVLVKRSYPEVFSDCDSVAIDGLGSLAYYPNRDSLGYMSVYGLTHIATFIRTTLRYPDFCKGWEQVIAMGLTDETNEMATDGVSIADFFSAHLKASGVQIADARLLQLFDFLGWQDTALINLGTRSSADILQWILENKWALKEGDKDMIVMLHEIAFQEGDAAKKIASLLVVKGEDRLHTAMAKTVGLPLGIAARLILDGTIQETGLHIPTVPGIYEPVLTALAAHGISFVESRSSV